MRVDISSDEDASMQALPVPALWRLHAGVRMLFYMSMYTVEMEEENSKFTQAVNLRWLYGAGMSDTTTHARQEELKVTI